jgi:hypothetical protein
MPIRPVTKTDHRLVDDLFNVLYPNFYKGTLTESQTRDKILDVLAIYNFFGPIAGYLFEYPYKTLFKKLTPKNIKKFGLDKIISSLWYKEVVDSLHEDAPSEVRKYIKRHYEEVSEYLDEIEDILVNYILDHPEYQKFKNFVENDLVLDSQESIKEQIIDYWENLTGLHYGFFDDF